MLYQATIYGPSLLDVYGRDFPTRAAAVEWVQDGNGELLASDREVDRETDHTVFYLGGFVVASVEMVR